MMELSLGPMGSTSATETKDIIPLFQFLLYTTKQVCLPVET